MSLRYLRRWLSSEGLQYLAALTNFERLGFSDQTGADAFPLKRMIRLLHKLGNPQKQLKVVHVIGSKGKGSVASFMASMFSASGMKIGRCVSPHAACITERLSVAGDAMDGSMEAISLKELDALILEHRFVAEAMRRDGDTPTYFEMVLALSFVHFLRAGVHHAIVESGLGGPTDATNVFPKENLTATVVCPMEAEHIGALGDDHLAVIENEMAVVQSHVPVVVAQQHKRHIDHQILQLCQKKEAPMIQSGVGVSIEHDVYEINDISIKERIRLHIDAGVLEKGTGMRMDDLSLRLMGQHQHENIKTAISAAATAEKSGWMLKSNAIHKGIEAAFIPGRFQVYRASPESEWFVLDGAHTPSSAYALQQTMRSVFPTESIVLILAMTKDKQHTETIERLIEMQAAVVIFASVQGDRFLPPGTLLAYWEQIEMSMKKGRLFRCRKTVTANVSTAVFKAQHEARRLLGSNGMKQSVICATGSLHVVGEVLLLIKASSLE